MERTVETEATGLKRNQKRKSIQERNEKKLNKTKEIRQGKKTLTGVT